MVGPGDAYPECAYLRAWFIRFQSILETLDETGKNILIPQSCQRPGCQKTLKDSICWIQLPELDEEPVDLLCHQEFNTFWGHWCTCSMECGYALRDLLLWTDYTASIAVASNKDSIWSVASYSSNLRVRMNGNTCQLWSAYVRKEETFVDRPLWHEPRIHGPRWLDQEMRIRNVRTSGPGSFAFNQY